MKNYLIVCAHKRYRFVYPSIYFPVQGGAKNKESLGDLVQRDDTGDNISLLNPQYSELTALYWGFKHLNYNILGLCHYRRYFRGKSIAYVNDKKIRVISELECEKILNKYQVILPKKRHYYIETLYNHYCRTLKKEPIIILGKIIRREYKDYLYEFNRLKKRRSAHMFNMMIGSKKFMDNYLKWLFSILEKVGNEIDSSNWNNYDKRYMGSISELLMDIYINKNKIKYKEIKYVEMIRFAKIRKSINYILVKYFNQKYKGTMK